MTATQTASATATATPSPTATVTDTATATPTSTVTPTLTPTMTSAPAGAVLDADGDGEVLPLTDGLLILRWLFDFTGESLIIGAVDTSDCTRCTADEIAAYVAVLGSQLDIDLDGELEPLTDGLLILRWLFGFTGDTLVFEAVDMSDCTRCTATEIEDYLDMLDG